MSAAAILQSLPPCGDEAAKPTRGRHCSHRGWGTTEPHQTTNAATVRQPLRLRVTPAAHPLPRTSYRRRASMKREKTHCTKRRAQESRRGSEQNRRSAASQTGDINASGREVVEERRPTSSTMFWKQDLIIEYEPFYVILF